MCVASVKLSAGNIVSILCMTHFVDIKYKCTDKRANECVWVRVVLSVRGVVKSETKHNTKMAG